MKSLVFLIAIGSLALGQTEPVTDTGLFPLQAGNKWIYRSQRADMIVEVVDSKLFGGIEYHAFRMGENDPIWLRSVGNRVLRYDPTTRQESQYLNLDASAGQAVGRFEEVCSPTGIVRGTGQSFAGPVGAFEGVLELLMSSICRDAGPTVRMYAPGVGLVYQETTTIAGPQQFNLIFAKVGMREISIQEGVAVSASINAPRIRFSPLPPRVEAILRVKNRGPEPLQLRFPSAQEVDLTVRNERGDIVASWSADKTFAAVATRRTVEKGQEVVWALQLALSTPATGPFSPGDYTAEIFLVGVPGYSVRIPFRVGPSEPNE